MGRKKRRSKQFKDSSKVIDMEQARAERQRRRESSAPKTEEVKKEVSPAASARQSQRRTMLRRRKQTRRLAVIGIAVVLVIIMGISLGNIIMLKHELHQAEKQHEEYAKEKEQLEKEMAEVNDLDYLEEQARDQMRLVKPGETLYIFPEDMSEE